MEEVSPFSWVNWYTGNYKQERPNLKVQPELYRIIEFFLLSELVDVNSQLRFQIVSFVFVNHICFSQLI